MQQVQETLESGFFSFISVLNNNDLIFVIFASIWGESIWVPGLIKTWEKCLRLKFVENIEPITKRGDPNNRISE